MSIHNKFVGDLMQQLKDIDAKLQVALAELKRARSFGDLRENSEYDIAKSNHLKLYNEKEKIIALLEAPVLHSKNTDIIEPGCIIAIKVYGPFKEISGNISDTHSLREMVFEHQPKMTEKDNIDEEPSFKGILLFGGLPDIYDFSVGKTMNVKSPIGEYINGKVSGIYTVQVPDGFVRVDVKKLKFYTSTVDGMSDTEYSISKFFEEVGEEYRQEECQPYYVVTIR